jgi:hypothetical protein
MKPINQNLAEPGPILVRVNFDDWAEMLAAILLCIM